MARHPTGRGLLADRRGHDLALGIGSQGTVVITLRWLRDHSLTRSDPTPLGNLTLPCWDHHQLIHDGKITIEKTPSGLVFRDSKGKVIEREPLKATGAGIAELNRVRGVEVTADLSTRVGW